MNKPIALFFAILLAACASVPDKVAEQTKTVGFVDTDTFDHQLSTALYSGTKTVSVKVLGNLSINNIPQRMGTWLNTVVKKDGELRYDPEPTADSKYIDIIAGVLIGIPAAYDYMENKALYRPTGSYNAVIHYNPDNGSIRSIDFVRREKPKGK